MGRKEEDIGRSIYSLIKDMMMKDKKVYGKVEMELGGG